MARILIAEDDDSVRAFVARALAMDRHDITEVADGEQGLACLAESNSTFDLLLSDIQMPGLDGIALAQAAARQCPKMKIVLMTGYAHQRERADELDSFVSEIVWKPFTLAEIRQRIDHVLAA
jgi:two-component system, cell cycle response regulator CpdR